MLKLVQDSWDKVGRFPSPLIVDRSYFELIQRDVILQAHPVSELAETEAKPQETAAAEAPSMKVGAKDESKPSLKRPADPDTISVGHEAAPARKKAKKSGGGCERGRAGGQQISQDQAAAANGSARKPGAEKKVSKPADVKTGDHFRFPADAQESAKSAPTPAASKVDKKAAALGNGTSSSSSSSSE